MAAITALPDPGSHDLSLPAWGPYAKRFFSLSHLADQRRGSRFDLLALPGLYRRQFGIPDALRPYGYLPFDAAPDLSCYRYRQQLEWRDRVYCDISILPAAGDARLLHLRFVNRTELPVDCALHLVALLEPDPEAGLPEPEGGRWLDATAHQELIRAVPGARDALVPDARRRGEIPAPDAVNGAAIRLEPGDRLRLPQGVPEPGESCWLRYRLRGSAVLNGHRLTGDGGWQLERWNGAPGPELRLEEGTPLELDGWFCSGREPEFRPAPAPLPEMEPGPRPNSVLLRFPGLERKYGLAWDRRASLQRIHQVRDLGHFFAYEDQVHQSYLPPRVEPEARDRIFDLGLQPLPLKPGALHDVVALAATGTDEEIAASFAAFPEDPEPLLAEAKTRYFRLPEGRYRFSQERMAAVTLTNVVYPIHLAGQTVRHHTPGRRWNSLYTWDSGFIGLGLLELDRRRALENLNAYLTAEGDPEKAFIHHGSPVPVQLFLFWELWNRGGTREELTFFYGRLRQYYDFLAGHHPGSRTAALSREGLLATWDYFYNSGGWDDYPPQVAMHREKRRDLTPVVTTAYLIRGAAMLRQAARELGLADDEAHYRADIERFSEALQRCAYDPESGYFGYVRHDADGRARGLFRAPDGSNFNCGLDGATPLVAGILTPEQRRRLYALLRSPEHLWTPVGLSTVDQSASYFRPDGYWNGSVWLPHQWFFWKAALNDGEADTAWLIAHTALETWAREVEDSYCCFEQFAISSGRGSGWPHFSGLSTPVLSFYAAAHRPGQLTAGYDVRIRNRNRCGERLTAELEIGGTPGERTTLLAAGPVRAAVYQGRPAALRRRTPELVELDLPKGGTGTLELIYQPNETGKNNLEE